MLGILCSIRSTVTGAAEPRYFPGLDFEENETLQKRMRAFPMAARFSIPRALTLEKREIAQNFLYKTEIWETQSLDTENNASSWQAKVYSPIELSTDEKKPAVLMLHHYAQDTLAEDILCEALVTHQAFCMILYFPQFGPRQSPSDEFISSDLFSTQNHLGQALLDIALAQWLLTQESRVDPQKMSLFGISLGAILGAAALGFLPRFPSGAILAMPGGNVPEILVRFANDRLNPTQRMSALLLGSALLGWVDPVFWAPSTRTSSLYTFQMSEDEIVTNSSYQAWRSNLPNTVTVINEVLEGRHVNLISHFDYLIERTLAILGIHLPRPR
jgi:hypothetical protein